jgi:hypothetical protein
MKTPLVNHRTSPIVFLLVLLSKMSQSKHLRQRAYRKGLLSAHLGEARFFVTECVYPYVLPITSPSTPHETRDERDDEQYDEDYDDELYDCP